MFQITASLRHPGESCCTACSKSQKLLCEGRYCAFLRPARDTGPGKACPAPPASRILSALHCHANIYGRKKDSKLIISGILKSKTMKIT